MSNNGSQDHPKNEMEFVTDTLEGVQAFAKVHNLTLLEATAILQLNETRNEHWHFDQWHAIFYSKAVQDGILPKPIEEVNKKEG